MELPLDALAILFAIALTAGFVDAIAGGGGLLTIPALMAAGLPPANALATNKLQASFGSLAASISFIRRGYVSFREIWPAVVCTFIGAAAGGLAVLALNPSFLRNLIPFLLIAAAVYFIFSPRAGDIEGHQRISHLAFALIFGTAIGFYDGFFGPGTGSFFVIAYVSMLGFALTRATAHTKVLNYTSNIASLLIFAASGKVVWTVGLVMAVGQFIGGRAGAHVVIGRGAGVVKPVLVTMCLAMTAKLVYDGSRDGTMHGIFTWLHAIGG